MLQTILSVIGVAALVIIAIVGVVILLFLWRMRQAWKTMRQLGKATGVSRPAQMTLQRQPDRVWEEPAMAAAVASLRERGFAHAGTFSIAEVGGAIGDGWVRGDGVAVALFNLNAAVPSWIDVTCRFPDNATLTVSNATMAEAARSAPWKQRSFLPASAGLPELLAEFERLRGVRAPVAIPASGFAAEVEESYAREIEWRALAGPDEAEIRRSGRAGGLEEPDADTLAACMLAERAWCEDVLKQRMRPRLLTAAGIDAATWERIEDRSIIVLDRMLAPDVACLLPADAGEEADGAAPPPADPFSCLGWWNAKAPAERRLRLAARIDQPLRAELWVPGTP